MRAALSVALITVVVNGCGPTTSCPVVDAGPALDAPSCQSRVVLGPVELGGAIGPSDGEFCSRAALRTGSEYMFRIRLLRGATEEVREVGCGSGTDYLDLGYVPPGAYEIVVEMPDGSRVLRGAPSIGSCDPDVESPGYCLPIPLVVGECDLDVVPLWLRCGTTGCEP